MKKYNKGIYKIIGSNIAYYRCHIGLNQESLASSVKVNRITVSHIERGRQKMTVDRLMDIADVLKIDYKKLIEEDHYVERVNKKSCANCSRRNAETDLCSYLDKLVDSNFYCKSFLKKGEK
jgi:transcriptional regulator with XRE-family HTH domain